MIFAYFLLAHLIADFLLQPKKLIEWKYKSWKGTAMHAFIHLLVMIVIVLPVAYSINGFVAILLLAASHFLIDLSKIEYQGRWKGYFLSFVVDQIVHLTFILLAAFFAGISGHGEPPLFKLFHDFFGFDDFITTHLLIILGIEAVFLIFITAFYDIAKFEFFRKDGSKFKADWRSVFVRIVVGSAFYALLVLLWSNGIQ